MSGTKRRHADDDGDDDVDDAKETLHAQQRAQEKRPAIDEDVGADEDEDNNDDNDEEPEEGDDVEIHFKGNKQPTAEELYEMAAEERGDGNDIVTTKLFEKAIEQFSKEDIERNKSEPLSTKFLISWANCLREFGEFYPVREYLEQAVDKFKIVLALSDLSKGQKFDALSGLGRAGLCLAQQLHEAAVREAAETLAENADDEDGDANGTNISPMVEPTPAELTAFTTGQQAYDELVGLTGYSKARMGNDMALYCKYLCAYCVDQGSERKTTLLQNAVDIATRAVTMQNDDFVQSVKGEAERSLAAVFADSDPPKAKQLAELAISSYETALTLVDDLDEINFDTFKGLADSYMLHSTLTSDEVETLASYDKGVQFMKRALQLDPGNVELSEMVAALDQKEQK